MPRKRPTRMLPPSQRRKQTGQDEPDFEANLTTVDGLLEQWGPAIHAYYELALAKGIAQPLTVLITPDSLRGNLQPLARSFTRSSSGSTIHTPRDDFESVLAQTHPDMIDFVRRELDEAYALGDGPPVVTLLADHVFVATCINKSEAN